MPSETCQNRNMQVSDLRIAGGTLADETLLDGVREAVLTDYQLLATEPPAMQPAALSRSRTRLILTVSVWRIRALVAQSFALHKTFV